MSSSASCAEVRELAPELALGIASGEDRARAFAHMASCADCRHYVDELATTADELLLLAPEREPSLGFEIKVLSALDLKRSRRRRLLLSAAAALVAIAVGAGGMFWATREDREVAGAIRETLAEANGKYFSVLPMHDSSGVKTANVFVYEGSPSWIFVVWDEPLSRDTFTIMGHMEDGGEQALGTFDSDGTKRTWGADLPGSLHDFSAISILAKHGVDSMATFSHGDD